MVTVSQLMPIEYDPVIKFGLSHQFDLIIEFEISISKLQKNHDFYFKLRTVQKWK